MDGHGQATDCTGLIQPSGQNAGRRTNNYATCQNSQNRAGIDFEWGQTNKPKTKKECD